MDFDETGLLRPGVHEMQAKDFIASFCKGEFRSQFEPAVIDLCDFATSRGGTRMLVGGSFVSRIEQPRDFDCVVVFEKESSIPERTERLSLHGTQLDIFFCSEDQPETLGAFVTMFQLTRYEQPVGIVEINLRDSYNRPLWIITATPDDRILNAVRRAYFNRHIADRNNSGRALVTVHGIKSHGDWNAEVAHVASSSGWIVAPYVYGKVGIDVFFRPSKRRRILDGFRLHLEDIRARYQCNLSVIAHSFGTYVVASYLQGFDQCPTPIDTLILTGAILNPRLDVENWRGKVGKVINEIAPADKWGKYATILTAGRDPLIGRCGEVGFSRSPTILQQQKCDVFDHNNVIKRDIVARRWLPWLEANVGKGTRDAHSIRRA
jgi:hypothetical protein